MDLYEIRRLNLVNLVTKLTTQAEFARRTGISPSYLSRMLKPVGEAPRKNIGEEMARQIESSLGLDEGDMDRLHGRSESKATGKHLVPAHDPKGVPVPSLFPQDAEAEGTISIALMNVHAAMGSGAVAPEHEEVVQRMVLSEPWLRRNAAFSKSDNLALVTGIGDSMAPTFHDGDVLMVDRGISDVKVDAVYVLSLKDELYIKRLQRRPDGSVLMISDNKSYEPYLIVNGERDMFRVLGRVVLAWNAKRM